MRSRLQLQSPRRPLKNIIQGKPAYRLARDLHTSILNTYSHFCNPVCFSDDSEADQDHSALPEADQDIATEEQKKQTFEQSIKNNIVFVDNDEDVPINYAEGDESRKCSNHHGLSFHPINPFPCAF